MFENKPPSGFGERSPAGLDRGKAPLYWDDVSFLDHRTARQYIERISAKLSPQLSPLLSLPAAAVLVRSLGVRSYGELAFALVLVQVAATVAD